MKRLKRKITSLIESREGSAMIEYAIGMLILVMLICFLTDVLIIANKKYVASQQVNTLSRRLAIQGGISKKAPKGYIGAIGDGTDTSDSYVTGSELITILNKNLGSAGISSEDWSLEIVKYDKKGKAKQTVNVKGSDSKLSQDISVDYGSGIDVTLSYKFEWTLLGQILGEDKTTNSKESRHVFSEFKFDYDSWDGE